MSMADQSSHSRVKDTVPKIDGDIAVGENLDFQRRWWHFERFIWIFFLLVLIADVLGLFGRGWLSKAELHTPDRALTLHYDWVERNSTPSVMTLYFGPAAVHNGRVQIFVSDSIIKSLGAQRIAPEPAASEIGQDGITYTIPANGGKMSMEIGLMPNFPGEERFEVRIPGSQPLRGTVFVVP